MGFTVTHRDGMTTDSEFEAYARLLRQSGVDLGKLPRVPEPRTNRRWLYVWDSEKKARAFAHELEKRTRDGAWEVVEAQASASEGPLGPLLVQMARRGEGLIFALHPLSRALLRSAFPHAVSATTTAIINTETWYEFLKTKGGLGALVQEVLPNLTGLGREELETLGYYVLDADTEKTMVFVAPAMAARLN